MTTFAGVRRVNVSDLERGEMVIVGAPYGVDYPGRTAHAEASPTAIRVASGRFARHMGHPDFTFGAPVIYDLADMAVDIGDIPRYPADEQHAQTAATIHDILARGCIPIVLGGDHSIPVGTIRGYAGAAPFWIVQFDAHLDIRDEIDGVGEGLSSGIRRALEAPWVAGVIQIGIRGLGSARREDLSSVAENNLVQITAREAGRSGIDALVNALPQGVERYYVTFDMDAFDPATAPAVIAPSFGGLDYAFVLETLEWLSNHGTMVGMDVVELAPDQDIHGITALLAARVILDAMVLASRKQ